MGMAAFIPFIVNNAMNAYNNVNEKRKENSNTLTDDEIIYNRERNVKPWDGVCYSHILPIDGTYTCNMPISDYLRMEENEYILI